jgi:hypothetical protein
LYEYEIYTLLVESYDSREEFSYPKEKNL